MLMEGVWGSFTARKYGWWGFGGGFHRGVFRRLVYLSGWVIFSYTLFISLVGEE